MEETYLLSAEKLFKKYYARLCHFAWQMLGDSAMAEDVVQDAFTFFLERQHLIANNDTAIKKYLFTSIRNACYNVSRTAGIEERYFRLNPAITIEESPVINNIIRSEVMNEVHSIITAMPKGCQKIFRLGYLEGWSNSKIAEELQVSVNTVKTQKQRGLKMLRSKLNPEFFGLFMLYTALASYPMYS